MRRVGIIGSGVVGQSLAKGFIDLGYEVKVGTREPGKLKKWLRETRATAGSPQDAAKFGELLVLCTKWDGARNAVRLAGAKNFRGKVVIDVTNPLKFAKQGAAPTMALAYPRSAGATVQRWLPGAKVVKAFNIITASRMTNPRLAEGTADLFIAGNHEDAKKAVMGIAERWGWSVHDIGAIEQSYLLESLAMLWITYGFRNNHWTHGFKLLKQ